MGQEAPRGLCPQCLLREGLTLVAASPLPMDAATRVVSAPGGAALGKPGLERFGDYELLHEIAHGGMGVVYAARQVSLNRPVALKMILSGQLATGAEVQRFRVEAEAAAKLDHPNIVPIYEIGERNGHHYFSMKLIAGGHLGERIAAGPLATRRAVGMMIKIARAMHYAHQHGVLHRDLKPTNVLVDGQDEPYLTDFGLAKLVEKETRLTQSEAVLGTANYMAPEQATGETSQITTAADVYGLGAILYEMLTAQPPFRAATLVETLRQVVDRDPVRPGARNGAVDRDLETVCLKCLEKLPHHRYASAEALAQDLERWLAGEPIHARPITAWERTLKWARRKPAIAGLLGLLALVGLGGFGGVLWEWKRAEDALRDLKLRDRIQHRNLYVADMKLAERALQEHNLGRAVQLISKYFPAAGEEDLRGFEWRYLWKQAHGDEQFTFQVGAYINAVAFSPDGALLAAGGHGPEIWVWEVSTRRLARKLAVGTAGVAEGFAGVIGWNKLQFSPDGKFLLARLETEAALCVWETATWRELARLRGLSPPVLFLPDGRSAVADANSKPAFLDLGTWQLKPDRPGPFADLGTPVACSPDGRYAVAAATGWGLLQLWEVPAGKKLNQFTLPPDQPNSWALAPGGQYLVAGDWQGRAKLWDCLAGRELAVWQAHANPLYGLAFSPDAHSLVTAGHDQVIHWWDLQSQSRRATLQGHLNEVWALACAPDGRLLASGGKDASVKLWPTTRTAEQTILTNAVQPLFFSADGRQLAALRNDQGLGCWEVASCRELPTNAWGEEFRASLLVRAGTGLVERGTLEGARAWEWARGERLPGLELDNQGVVAVSPDRRLLAAAARGYTVKLWDVPQRRLLGELRAHQWVICALVFSPDSRHLLVTSLDANASLWNAAEGTLAATLSGHKEGITCGAFSPDGKTVATGSTDDTVKLWNVAARQELLTLRFGGDIGFVRFSPEGNTLAVGGQQTSAGRMPVHLCRAPALGDISPQGPRQLP